MRFSKQNQLIIFSAVAAATTALALARDYLQTDPEKLIKKTVEEALQKWKTRLFLTPDQTERMRATLTEFAHKKNSVLRLKINREGKRERLREIQLLENEEMRKFLGNSQYDQYVTILAERVK